MSVSIAVSAPHALALTRVEVFKLPVELVSPASRTEILGTNPQPKLLENLVQKKQYPNICRSTGNPK